MKAIPLKASFVESAHFIVTLTPFN